jgi:hypothetical protein
VGLLDRPDGTTLLAIFVVCALGLLALAATALRGRLARSGRQWRESDDEAAYPTDQPAPVTAATPRAEPRKAAAPRKTTGAKKTTAAKRAAPRSTSRAEGDEA